MSSVRRGHINALLFLVPLLSLAEVPQQGQQLPCLIRSLREGGSGLGPSMVAGKTGALLGVLVHGSLGQ